MWTAHRTAAYCARHRFGAGEAVLVRGSARTDSCFLRKRRPISFMNRPGRSIHFIDRSIAPKRRVPSPDYTFPQRILRYRDARIAIPSLQLRRSLSQRHAVEGQPLIQSFIRPVVGRSAMPLQQPSLERGDTNLSRDRYSERANSRRINEFVCSGSTLAAVSAWASPSGDGSTRAAAATLPEPTSGLRAFA